MTKSFNVNIGVRQGDALSAVLFDLVRDHIISKIDIRGNVSTKMVQIRAYADNIVIISRSMKTLEETLQNYKM
jgi:hypothetical protein